MMKIGEMTEPEWFDSLYRKLLDFANEEGLEATIEMYERILDSPDCCRHTLCAQRRNLVIEKLKEHFARRLSREEITRLHGQ